MFVGDRTWQALQNRKHVVCAHRCAACAQWMWEWLCYCAAVFPSALSAASRISLQAVWHAPTVWTVELKCSIKLFAIFVAPCFTVFYYKGFHRGTCSYYDYSYLVISSCFPIDSLHHVCWAGISDTLSNKVGQPRLWLMIRVNDIMSKKGVSDTFEWPENKALFWFSGIEHWQLMMTLHNLDSISNSVTRVSWYNHNLHRQWKLLFNLWCWSSLVLVRWFGGTWNIYASIAQGTVKTKVAILPKARILVLRGCSRHIGGVAFIIIMLSPIFYFH